MKLPAAIQAWLAERVTWPAALPAELAPGEVTRLASGGPFGLMFDGRLDEVDGRVALEVLENSRMGGESYFRVWDDGTIEPLEPAPWTAFAYASEEERPAAEAAYYAHNRAAYAHLRERGFFSEP